jgi:hypothetical protein
MFVDFEKAISILKTIEGMHRANAELESDGHRYESAKACHDKAEAIAECITKLYAAWNEEENAFAKHYQILNKEDIQCM